MILWPEHAQKTTFLKKEEEEEEIEEEEGHLQMTKLILWTLQAIKC